MAVPNPFNDFVPKVGDLVKIVGACHPKSVGRVVMVTSVDLREHWFECVWEDSAGQKFYTGGELGGLAPWPDTLIFKFEPPDLKQETLEAWRVRKLNTITAALAGYTDRIRAETPEWLLKHLKE